MATSQVNSKSAAKPVRIKRGDLPGLERLLRDNGLPWQDCADQWNHFYGLFDAGRLIAAGGLEPAGDCALLRSIVVDPQNRSRGLGRAIADFLIARSRAQGLPAIYLLTETAESYFQRLGFVSLAREQLPASIRKTRQFESLCPQSAICMQLDLER